MTMSTELRSWRRPSNCFSWWLLIVFYAFLSSPASSQWVPVSKGKPTELVITRYENLISQGAFLSPRGWERASKIFAESNPYPANGVINVITTGGILGEDWNKDDHAQVETKWTDYVGSIDSELRLKQGPYCPVMTIFTFRLVFTNKHRGVPPDGKATETIGNWEWKIADPQKDRYATIPEAITYLRAMRDRTKYLQVRKNANDAIRRLKKSTRPASSAC